VAISQHEFSGLITYLSYYTCTEFSGSCIPRYHHI